jgi:hypothetical protein
MSSFAGRYSRSLDNKKTILVRVAQKYLSILYKKAPFLSIRNIFRGATRTFHIVKRPSYEIPACIDKRGGASAGMTQ